MAIDPQTDVGQVRLLVGDTADNTADQYLADSIYTWLLSENSNDVLETAVEALENIINQLALAPERSRIGDAEEYRADIRVLENRLEALKLRRNRAKKAPVPMIINSDRKDWDDFSKIFGE